MARSQTRGTVRHSGGARFGPIHPTAKAPGKGIRRVPMDRSKLAGEIAEPLLKARGTQLDLPLDERHQHHRRAETHIIGCVGDEPGRQQTGPLRLRQRSGLVRCQIGLICEPRPDCRARAARTVEGVASRAHSTRNTDDEVEPFICTMSRRRVAPPIDRRSHSCASSLKVKLKPVRLDVHRRQSNFGTSTSRPPAIADSCAQMPAAVQLAAVTASIQGCRRSTMLRTNS